MKIRTPSIHTLYRIIITLLLLLILSGSNQVTASPQATSGYLQQITAGLAHTCALTSSGGVNCWGDNSKGQLGDGTTTNRYTPVDVSNLTSGVSAIATGGSHTCALTTSGGVKCWGYNNYGQLGDGSTTNRHTPVDVSGLTSGVSAIAAGEEHTCALTTSGGVKCWGQNYFGQLGDGTTFGRLTPVDVSGLTSGVSAIAASGYGHTCALTMSGGAKCWGYNYYGQLGDGTTTNRYTPVDVSGLTSGISAITAGGNFYTCALTTSGGVKCWGDNTYGQLGDGTTTPRLTPVDVSGLTSGINAIAANGFGHTCVLTTVGGAKCWGYNYYGQLGDGTTTNRYTPVNVSDLDNASAIAEGSAHTCALTTSGEVKCWGRNIFGLLGDGTTIDRHTPVNLRWMRTYLEPSPNLGLCSDNGPCFSSLADALNATSTASGYLGSVFIYPGSFTQDWNLNVAVAAVNLLGDVSLTGSLSQSDSLFNLGSHTLVLTGNLARSGGTFDAGTGSLSFNGSGVQNISGLTTLYNLIVGSGVTLATSDSLTLNGSLTNLGVTQETRFISAPGSQSFSLAGININITTQGALSQLVVERRDDNHPNAATPQLTGRWWNIAPTGSGYTAELTLPFDADDQDKVCRYSGSETTWTCNASSYIAGVSVSWEGIQEFSDWAVGNDAPTAVTLSSFTATPYFCMVNLAWTTQLEYRVLGYNLYFSSTPDAEKVRLNASLIPPQSLQGKLPPFEYVFAAPAASQGVTYYYWLEVVEVDGSSTWYGPAAISGPLEFWIFLPFIH